jgi:hypothetical protein
LPHYRLAVEHVEHNVNPLFIYNISATSLANMLANVVWVKPSFHSKAMPALDYREKGRATRAGISLAVRLKVTSSP